MFGSEKCTGLGMPGQALHIAVSIRIDGRAGKRIVGWNFALSGDSEDLSSQGMQILGKLRMGGIARADVQHPVRSEGDASAVMIDAGRDARHDVAVKLGVVAEVLQPNDGIGRPASLLPR